MNKVTQATTNIAAIQAKHLIESRDMSIEFIKDAIASGKKQESLALAAKAAIK